MAISLDTSAKASGSGSSLTKSYTIGSGSNRILCVWIRTDGTASPTSVKYNSIDLTKLYEVTTGSMRLSYWYLLEASMPSAGAYNIVVAWAASKDYALVASSWSGVNQATPSYTTSTGTASSYKVTRTITEDNSIALMHVSDEEDAAITPGTGQTELQDTALGDENNYEAVNAGSVTQTATGSSALYRTLLHELNTATSSAQTITATGISSVEAFGTAIVSYTIAQTSIASAEAIDGPKLNLQLVLTGIATAEALGSIVVTPGNVNLAPTGITSQEAHGSPILARGGVTVISSGIASQENVEDVVVLRGNVNIVLTGVASTEVFGTSTLARGNVNVVVSGIASGEATGSSQLNRSIFTTGIASAQAFGTSTLARGNVNIGANGIVSSESFGSPILARGGVTVISSGIASQENVEDVVVLRGNVNIVLTGIASALTFGSITLTVSNVNIVVTSITSEEQLGDIQQVSLQVNILGIASTEVFGDIGISQAGYVSPPSIDSVEAFGSIEIVRGKIDLLPSSIASAQAFGTSTLARGNVNIGANGIVSSESFGSPILARGGVTVISSGIASQEAFGDLEIVVGMAFILMPGILSDLTFGAIVLMPFVDVVSIASAEEFGTTTLHQQIIVDTGITTSEDFGTSTIQPGNRDIESYGIPSTSSFGTAFVKRDVVDLLPSGTPSNEVFGTPMFPYFISTTSIDSEEAIGTCDLTFAIAFVGIESKEAFGNTTLYGYRTLTVESILSTESFGAHFVIARVLNPLFTSLESDLDEVFFNNEEFADDAQYIYNPYGPFNIPVIFDREYVEVNPGVGAGVQMTSPTIMAQASKFRYMPNKNDRVVIRGERFRVMTAEPDGVGLFVFKLYRE